MKEIERKFLVDKSRWRPPQSRPMQCRQGYIFSDENKSLRVRIIDNEAFVTIKAKDSGISRYEFEYPIPLEHAEVMLEKLSENVIIEKKRYIVIFDDVKWEVDEFTGENAGLITAEVELENADEKIKLPDWISREVTADPRYLNVNLAKKPYSSFS